MANNTSWTDATDTEVLADVAALDFEALEELSDRYKTMAYSIAYRITNDRSLAEDVVQEAFIDVYRNSVRYVEGRGSVKTWLLAIVHHRAIDTIRHRRRRRTTELPGEDGVWPAALTRPDVWYEVAADLDAETVQQALAGLSAVQRVVLEMAYFGGLSQREIADQTNTPLGTVKSRLRLGLLAMRRQLESDQAAESPTEFGRLQWRTGPDGRDNGPSSQSRTVDQDALGG